MKDIPGYEGKYKATEDGKIFSVKANRFLTLSDDTYNYNTCCLYKDGVGRTIKVHKVIASTFLTNPDNHPVIDHINRNRKDNRSVNLRYSSISNNNFNRNPNRPYNLELRNIITKKSTYKVCIVRAGLRIYKSFKTLDEAKAYRDAVENTINTIVEPLQEPTVAL